MAGARHGICELTARHVSGTAWEQYGHGMVCVNRPLLSDFATGWENEEEFCFRRGRDFLYTTVPDRLWGAPCFLMKKIRKK
jgi:hypothetical protein